MKRTSFAVVFALMLAACFALAGCGKPAVEIESESGAAEPSDDTQSAVSQTESAAESGVSGAADTSSVQSGTAAGTKGGAAGNTGSIAKAPAKTNGKAQNGAADDKAQTAGRPANSAYDHYAGPGDEREIAKLIIKYINEERAKEGAIQAVELTGKTTEFAQRHSATLLSGFEHNVERDRALATEMKFGEYVDLAKDSLEWNNPDIPPEVLENARNSKPYYSPPGQNGIACVPQPLPDILPVPLEDIARDAVDAFLLSPGHWSYIGAKHGSGYENYKYIAVGVTRASSDMSDSWYVSVWVSDKDIDALYG